jgi:phosphoglycolate phosphatase
LPLRFTHYGAKVGPLRESRDRAGFGTAAYTGKIPALITLAFSPLKGGLGMSPLFLYTLTMPVRLIIFDLDGTLIDSIADITDALNYALEPLHLLPLAPHEVKGMIGEGALRLVEKVSEKYGVDVDAKNIVRRYTERYALHLTDRTSLYPGTKETLEGLTLYNKAIISNKSEALSRGILDRFDLSGCFDMVVGADTIPDRKPSPAPVLHVLSAFRALPDEAVMVGDSEIDIMTGTAARVRTVAVTHGYGRSGFEKDADFVIAGLTSLPPLVRALDR